MLKKNNILSFHRWQRIIIAASCVALASQIEFNAFFPGFIIALSALLLPVFLYFNQDLNPLQFGLAIAIASPVFRGIVLLLTHNTYHVINYTLADILYFFSYSLIYYLLYWQRHFHNNSAFFLTIVLCDYVANLVEIGFLTKMSGFSLHVVELVFLVAIIRTIIATLLAFIFHYFQLLIVRNEDHERQYYHFIWVAAAVKSEVYFMKKAINDIENVTKNAYLLNERLKVKQLPEEQKMAYEVAQRVHEIKHSYQDVIKGLGDYFNDQNNVPMQMSDILKIVSSHSQAIIHSRQLNINLVVQNELIATIPEHYYLVTILSNLIINGIDAIGKNHNGEISIKVISQGENVQIIVHDNGQGIPQAMLPLIFKAGFSTKFDQSGDIYRGIGLSNVYSIIHDQFDGHIKVNSQEGIGTTFTISLNKKILTSKGGQVK